MLNYHFELALVTASGDLAVLGEGFNNSLHLKLIPGRPGPVLFSVYVAVQSVIPPDYASLAWGNLPDQGAYLSPPDQLNHLLTQDCELTSIAVAKAH